MNVFTVGNKPAFHRMFKGAGFRNTSSIREAELVVFTGGEDVTPSLYGEVPHPTTHCNPVRDQSESRVYGAALHRGVPMVGVCRGGQFLNVMNGGTLWQHVEGHMLAHTHEIMDKGTNILWEGTSTHHQMMRPARGGKVIAAAYGQASLKERMLHRGEKSSLFRWTPKTQEEEDVEVVYYPSTKCLCFQPHPEFYEGECREVFFTYLKAYCFDGADIP